jgi:hypothetical protein
MIPVDTACPLMSSCESDNLAAGDELSSSDAMVKLAGLLKLNAWSEGRPTQLMRDREVDCCMYV